MRLAAYPTYSYKRYRLLKAVVKDLSQTKVGELDGTSGGEQYLRKKIKYQLLAQRPIAAQIAYHSQA
jgi:hypothetical protein